MKQKKENFCPLVECRAPSLTRTVPLSPARNVEGRIATAK